MKEHGNIIKNMEYVIDSMSTYSDIIMAADYMLEEEQLSYMEWG